LECFSLFRFQVTFPGTAGTLACQFKVAGRAPLGMLVLPLRAALAFVALVVQESSAADRQKGRAGNVEFC